MKVISDKKENLLNTQKIKTYFLKNEGKKLKLTGIEEF